MPTRLPRNSRLSSTKATCGRSSSSTRGGRSQSFPLTAGVVGAVIAPVLAAVAAIVAMLKDCTIEIEKADADVKHEPPRAAAG